MRWLQPVLPPLLLSLLLGGCLGSDNLRLSSLPGISSLWGDEPPAAAAAQGTPPTQYYCYRNIGKVDCYVAPDPQRRQ